MHVFRFATVLAAVTTLAVPVTFAAGSAPQPSICTRSCWGARAPSSSISQMGALNRAIIHHTANAGEFNTTSLAASQANVRNNQNYHMDVNGWSDIGYHFLFDKLGNVFEGRSGSMSSRPRGAHDGVNDDSFGFSNMGYFHPPHNQSPPTTMRNKVYDTIAWRMPNGYSANGSGSYGGNTVGRLDGHRSAKATACPGDVWWPFIGTNYSGGEARNAINARINGTGGPSTITVDNSSGGFSASANWSTGSSATDKFGADYRFRPTEAISDRASWTGTLPAAGSYSISAWWTEGTNRSANVSYTLPDASTVAVNQQANGGKWNLLANKSLSSGANTVYLSCWATTGFVAVADAVRFVGPN